MPKEKITNLNRYLGLDLSTQSLTAVVIDLESTEIHRFSLNFDDTFPSYKTSGGVLPNDDPKVAHSDPRMWIEALDTMLNLLKEKGLSRGIIAIGVSAQQHGTVYLNDRAQPSLSALNPTLPMVEQINAIFTRPTAPIWMDVSTTRECQEISDALGGDFNLVKLTGSIATERFMGPQVRRFWKNDPEKYAQTKHIALISSFVTSMLTGHVAPVDTGDGFGTNLANIRTGKWNRKAISATAPNLRRKLPELAQKDQFVGNVSNYLVHKYGFNPETEVIVGSGDNPNSLVGLGLIGDNDKKAISLGTSDTYFGYVPRLYSQERTEGHIFGTADGRYMVLICYLNGSLAREQIKNQYGLSWNDFSNILMETQPGNQGRIMLPYFFPEITPKVLEPGVKRFGGLGSNDARAEVRAITEAQAMAMYLHSEWTGHRPNTIFVTAGGSENRGLLKVISQVFGAEVRSFEVKESAALGAAIRAAYCYLKHKGKRINWNELIEPYIRYNQVEVFKSSKNEVAIYSDENGLMEVYKACERYALGNGEHPQEKIEAFKQRFGI